MKKLSFLLVLSLLWGCRVGEEGAEDDYGPNHALVTQGSVKYKKDCLSCHNFTYAGTVWSSPNGSPASNVKVILKAAAGDSLVLTTDSYGNFYTTQSLSGGSFSAYIVCSSGKKSMGTQPSYGGCNSCHQPEGSAGNVVYCTR